MDLDAGRFPAVGSTSVGDGRDPLPLKRADGEKLSPVGESIGALDDSITSRGGVLYVLSSLAK